MSESPMVMADNSDPEMQRAYENARATFRYFWREVAWDRRRFIPALSLACVKAPFSDGKQGKSADRAPKAEHMWLSEIDFDGEFVSGVLMNSPNWVKTVKKGDSVRLPPDEISDWMYAISGVVYGAYTVNLLRARMGEREREEHDGMWGLNFRDPTEIRLVPGPREGASLKSKFGDEPADADEHPMSENMAASLEEHITKNPSLVTATSDRGWTLLHQEALAGSAATVKVLLEAGADRDIRTHNGKTPLQLAQSLGWEKVVALLTSR
ncbi:MAG: DUF2314 domain-containing protein [Planctomycetes bacterium]|nr:DUF2314 domain-containing protein [Planctomycetota bacterium]